MATATKTTQPIPDWWPRELLNEQRTAELLGMSVMSLRDWRCRRTRDLPYLKVGSSVRYEPTAVWAWLDRNAVRAVQV